MFSILPGGSHFPELPCVESAVSDRPAVATTLFDWYVESIRRGRVPIVHESRPVPVSAPEKMPNKAADADLVEGGSQAGLWRGFTHGSEAVGWFMPTGRHCSAFC